MLDIGHESLIPPWHQLYQWVEEEAVAATRYRRLAERAEFNARGEADLMTDRELAVTVEWHEAWRPNAAWAIRYHRGFEAAEDFLRESRAAHARRRLWRLAGLGVAAMLLFGILIAGSAVVRRRRRRLTRRRTRTTPSPSPSEIAPWPTRPEPERPGGDGESRSR